MPIRPTVGTTFLGQITAIIFLITCPRAAVLESVSELIPCTRVSLKDSASLSCTEPCGGVAQWRRGGATVAQCGRGAQAGLQFSCTVEEERSSLTVPQVNYSTRGHYSVYCDGREMPLCRQLLQPLHKSSDQSTLELEAGQYLSMAFHTSDRVIVKVRTPGTSSSTLLCTVDGRLKQCHPDYQDRVHIVDNTFILMDMAVSDSGTYSVEEEQGVTVSIFNVTIRGGPRSNIKIEHEPKNNANIYLSIITLNDVYQSRMWKEGYHVGFGHGASAFGLGVLVICMVLGITLSWVFRRKKSPISNQEDTKNSVPLNDVEK